jgi:transcription elongation GreA/GreB family factor
MSRAFVRENDDAHEALPEREISEHPNYVTEAGLDFLDARLTALGEEWAEAKTRGDKTAQARIERDQRYFTARRASARVIAVAEPIDAVRFGVRVVLGLDDGSERAFRLVGEDEAAPGRGHISWISPLARTLLGLARGDVVEFQGNEAEILRLEK